MLRTSEAKVPSPEAVNASETFRTAQAFVARGVAGVSPSAKLSKFFATQLANAPPCASAAPISTAFPTIRPPASAGNVTEASMGRPLSSAVR